MSKRTRRHAVRELHHCTRHAKHQSPHIYPLQSLVCNATAFKTPQILRLIKKGAILKLRHVGREFPVTQHFPHPPPSPDYLPSARRAQVCSALRAATYAAASAAAAAGLPATAISAAARNAPGRPSTGRQSVALQPGDELLLSCYTTASKRQLLQLGNAAASLRVNACQDDGWRSSPARATATGVATGPCVSGNRKRENRLAFK